MDNENMIEILNRIELFIKQDALDLAKDMTKLEIENINGITEQDCKNRYYNFYNYYCKECRNLNCNNNCNSKAKK